MVQLESRNWTIKKYELDFYKDLMRPNHGPRVAEYYVEVLN